MPLTECPDCHKEISDQAASCINCGRPMTANAADRSPMNESVDRGNQSSKLKHDMGHAIAFVGIIIAVVVGMTTNAIAGWSVAGVGCLLGVIVAYS